jgi:hypothetical protein
MKTAEERSDYFIWYVLDRIMEMTLPDGSREVKYYLDVNIRRKEPIPFLKERSSLLYLLKNNAIESTDEIGIAENDKKGTPEYVVEEIYSLKLGKRWNEFYDRYNMKVNPSTTESVKKSWDRSVERLLQVLEGDYEKKLVLILFKKELTVKELEIEIGAKAIRKLISNTNKKIIKQGLKIDKTNEKGLDGLSKYKLDIS